jgi:carboxylesterase
MPADATPFGFEGDERGVLCIHGFTGTPYEMRHLGRRLHQRGLTVVGPTLPGHGTSPDQLNATTWEQWYDAVDAELSALRRRCARVAVVGQSLGGLLALLLARRRGDELCAVGTLAAPLWLSPLARALLRATAEDAPLAGLAELPKVGGSDVRDGRTRRENPSYRVFPLRALHQLRALMDVVKGELPAIRVPAVIVHGRRDHTAPYACSEWIAAHIGAPLVRHRPLPESFHLVAVDVERDVVAAEVATFFEAQLGPSTPAPSAGLGQDER